MYVLIRAVLNEHGTAVCTNAWEWMQACNVRGNKVGVRSTWICNVVDYEHDCSDDIHYTYVDTSCNIGTSSIACAPNGCRLYDPIGRGYVYYQAPHVCRLPKVKPRVQFHTD